MEIRSGSETFGLEFMILAFSLCESLTNTNLKPTVVASRRSITYVILDARECQAFWVGQAAILQLCTSRYQHTCAIKTKKFTGRLQLGNYI